MNKLPIILLAAILMAGISCSKKKSHTLRGEARMLYSESLDTTRAYIDSISNAADSSTLLSLCERYDEAITRLNYGYPPGTDYEISEGENDTLMNLFSRFISVRDSLLYALGRLPAEEPDSAMTCISHDGQSK